MAQAQELEVEYATVAPASESPISEESSLDHLSQTTRVAIRAILFGLLFILPFAFGGVHPTVYLSAYLLIFFSASVLSITNRQRIIACFADGSWSSQCLLGILACVAYAALQTMVLALTSQPHPVIGQASLLTDSRATYDALTCLTFFAATFICFRTWLYRNAYSARRLISTLLFCGLAVSLTALCHWFYDNGKLFWTFEPVFVFASDRARWPFVNSNHLAHFLLPTVFLLFALLQVHAHEVKEVLLNVPTHAKRSLPTLIHSKKLQRSTLRLVFQVAFLIAAILCIAGSLSRGSWFALVIGLLTFTLLERYSRRSRKNASDKGNIVSFFSHSEEKPQVVEEPRFNRRKHRRRQSSERFSRDQINRLFSTFSRVSKPVLFLFSALIIFVFLKGRGTQLVSARIEYGLLYSHDDMRWQLYVDSLPMIREHLLFGVGLGAWASQFPQYMNQLLAGVIPEYLHSDPLQLLAELGTIGFAIVAATVLLLARDAIRIMKRAQNPDRQIILGLLCGGLTLIVASFFDFPFRIPAIVFYSGCYLGLLAFYLDKSLKEQRSDHAQ